MKNQLYAIISKALTLPSEFCVISIYYQERLTKYYLTFVNDYANFVSYSLVKKVNVLQGKQLPHRKT